MSLTDADDSIVLSDLLRSGEASRLRRRGAIFIRDPSGSSSSSSQPTSYSLPPARPPTSPSVRRAPPVGALSRSSYADDYDEDDEDDGDEYGPEWGFGPLVGTADSADLTERDARRLEAEAEMRLEDADHAAGTFALYCGGMLDACPADDEDAVPIQPRRKPSAFCKLPPRAQPRRPNGCGTLIHLSAIPRRNYGVWIARGNATDALLPMDAEYFDCRAVQKMHSSTCGCVREGVGCRYCGNPLGTIFTPCPAAAAGLFSSTPSPSPSRPSTAAPPGSPPLVSLSSPTIPNSTSYRVPRSQRPRSDPPSLPPTSVFTFFASAVRSSPSFMFPIPSAPAHSHTRMSSTSSSQLQPQLRPRWPTYTRRLSRDSFEDRNDDPDGEDSSDGEDETVRDLAPDDSAEKIDTPSIVWLER
ncbi:hypothetical protein K488DRAFT_85001 [Vararia minispora EC-137]|uniref:Uncharacterized protein n=1 Tax=Vararia minispora EC-137 TaxID=1314806 RepID=A0ACB8QNV7_9AGAM|nr:hypothetical protein K488DRAFT_85001 [Vararia minispora EC-137]